MLLCVHVYGCILYLKSHSEKQTKIIFVKVVFPVTNPFTLVFAKPSVWQLIQEIMMAFVAKQHSMLTGFLYCDQLLKMVLTAEKLDDF